MNFELKFCSHKGVFNLNVDYIAVLHKALIPSAYLVPSESLITTTDEAGIRKITQHLLSSPISQCGETEYALLVQANGSRWLLYGVVDTIQGSPSRSQQEKVMKVKARMIGGHIFNGIHRPHLQPGESTILVKKVKNALDEHVIKTKKRKRSTVEQTSQPILAQNHSSVPELFRTSSSRIANEHTIVASGPAPSTESTPAVATERLKLSLPDSAQAMSQDKASTHAALTINEDAMTKSSLQDKCTKDKLKKMIITLLSLQGISKTSPAFKDLYQHTLQASSFALRSFDGSDKAIWEENAMSINQNLIRIFMGQAFKDPS